MLGLIQQVLVADARPEGISGRPQGSNSVCDKVTTSQLYLRLEKQLVCICFQETMCHSLNNPKLKTV